jgi:hypothetical protein
MDQPDNRVDEPLQMLRAAAVEQERPSAATTGSARAALRDRRAAENLACVIHNADARLLDRNVQSSKIVHAALLF